MVGVVLADSQQCARSANVKTHALTEYHHQFEHWEATPNHPRLVIRASILINQAFARFIFALEPFKNTAKAVQLLANLITKLGSFLTQHHLTDSTQLWNGLGRLADKIFQA
ncbi:hypothetical protein PtA15_14A64 [Puccinia triticina]|uniref:Ras-GEF domain-containing protein n=1 Tax=Puccinia triticina TaxID=208348 RepID=A0ABY7D3M0_9BASI|nr:uncharacterized protein PtA15_14A64 [Puccinia triticina]WAQ91183.1 hypothetical protein PtA15_14A64 [Puccinia triticina]WAR61982.1 hypothetical protein PtB15_14B75 [Puccinia triticina]